ncbi:MAG TPA: hypothetical protein VH595_13460 [Verrucomicrobiae bacterium]|jgi:hypothetical protein|nr:hypothetical protein [Verrucomicrobiae bacterium]
MVAATHSRSPEKFSLNAGSRIDLASARFFECFDIGREAARYFQHGGFARDFSRPVLDERIPEIRASNGEPDEPRNACGRDQPFVDLLVFLAAAQTLGGEV